MAPRSNIACVLVALGALVASVRLMSMAGALGVALLLGGGCRAKEAPAPAASARVAEAPAPASLVAELSIGNPKETWQRLRQLGGGLANAVPSSLPVLFTTSLSMPPAAAGSIDESVPIVGALLSREGSSEPDAVVGVHVTSGAELVASLTLGSEAKFRQVQLEPRLVRLVAAPGAVEPSGALGVSGNYLLIASRVEALREAGRFVAESVSQRARSEPGFSLRASEQVLRGALPQRLREAWQAQRAELSSRDRALRDTKGRAPDFADPAVLLAGADGTIESWLSVLESSRALELVVTPEATRLGVELRLTPGADGAAALLSRELVTGPLSPLLALPRGTLAALALRGDPQPSREAAEALGKSVTQLFGERVSPDDATKLVRVLGALAQARHGATVIGFIPSPTPALVVTCQVTDGEAFRRALADALALVELPPVSAWLAGTVGKPSLQVAKSTTGPAKARLRLQRAAATAKLPLPPALSVSWDAKDGVAWVVVSTESGPEPAALQAADKLAASSFLARAEREWGERAALGVWGDARLFAPGGPDDAPILLVVGKREERISVAMDLSPAALRALAGFWVR